METFTDPKELAENPHYHEQRQEHLARLDLSAIDAPVADLIRGFSERPCCFTLQSCYGHFLYNAQRDPYNTDPLPISEDIAQVEYKIAYIALCVENSPSGRSLLRNLRETEAVDPAYVQFGCAEWFWERQVNSYALQVEPRRHMTKDRIVVDYSEALYIEKIRNRFFSQLSKVLQKQTEIG